MSGSLANWYPIGIGFHRGGGGPELPGGKSHGDTSGWGGQCDGGWRSCGNREWDGGVDSALAPAEGARCDFLAAAPAAAARGDRPGLGSGGRGVGPGMEGAPCARADR